MLKFSSVRLTSEALSFAFNFPSNPLDLLLDTYEYAYHFRIVAKYHDF